MNHALATAIAAEYAPTLLVDPVVSNRMLVVRKEPDGMPFSITLSDANPAAFQDIPASDATPEIPAVMATDDRPGRPAIPARPAVVARTVAGQVAEAERAMLIAALDAAKQVLGA